MEKRNSLIFSNKVTSKESLIIVIKRDIRDKILDISKVTPSTKNLAFVSLRHLPPYIFRRQNGGGIGV